MNELERELRKLDNRVYEIIENASDHERSKQAKDYYLNGKGSPFSLIELGIAESVRQEKLEIIETMLNAFELECSSKHMGNFSLTRFCLFSGLCAQFFRPDQPPRRGKKRLYVILVSNGTVKIGIAHDIQRRFSQITASSGMEIVKHLESELIEDAYTFETALHREYKAKRLKGEYFDIDYEKAVEQAQRLTRSAS